MTSNQAGSVRRFLSKLFGDSIRVRFVDSKGKVVYGMSRGWR